MERRVLAGAYRIGELVGSGGFADVYLGRDVRTNTVVAIKVLHAQYGRDPVLVERFLREARMARVLSEPHVVRVLDAGKDGEDHFIVMEYVQGLTLDTIVERRGALPIGEAVGYTCQVLQALEAAHGAGIVHRDIKPQNLMVLQDGTVKVMDFGIAKEAAASITRIGQSLGTPHYMSPEQALGNPVDSRTDLYSVGIVLYELLIGRVPFAGDSHWSVINAHINEPPPPLRSARPEIPPELESVVLGCLAKESALRPESAAVLRRALQPFADMPAGKSVAGGGGEPGAAATQVASAIGAAGTPPAVVQAAVSAAGVAPTPTPPVTGGATMVAPLVAAAFPAALAPVAARSFTPVPEPVEIVCSACGMAVAPDVSFCPNCGQALGSVPPRPASVTEMFGSVAPPVQRKGAGSPIVWLGIAGVAVVAIVVVIVILVAGSGASSTSPTVVAQPTAGGKATVGTTTAKTTAGPTFSPAAGAASLVVEAKSLIATAKYDQAIANCTRAMEIDPKYAEAYVQRGIAYYGKERYDSALTDLNKALDLDTKSATAYSARGDLYYQWDEYDTAVSDYAKALQIDVNLAAAYLGRGKSYYQLAKYDLAQADLSKVIRLDPGNASAYNWRGNTYYSQGNKDQAVVDYSKALELDPGKAAYYYNRGDAYRQLAKYDLAVSDLNRAIGLDANYISAYNSRGRCYYSQGKYDLAITDFGRAAELDPEDPTNIINRGNAWKMLGKYDQAIADYNAAIKLDPSSAWAYAERGASYYVKSSYDQALADLNKSIQLDVSYDYAYNVRGNVYYTQAKYSQALADYSKAIELDPEYAWAFYNRGNTHKALKDATKAKADYEKALSLAKQQGMTSLAQSAQDALSKL